MNGVASGCKRCYFVLVVAELCGVFARRFYEGAQVLATLSLFYYDVNCTETSVSFDVKTANPFNGSKRTALDGDLS